MAITKKSTENFRLFHRFGVLVSGGLDKKESTTMPSINYLRPISKLNFTKYDLQLPVRDFAQA